MNQKEKKQKRQRRRARIRTKVQGSKEMPRLCVFRSNQHIYAQLVDDAASKIIAAASSLELKKKIGKLAAAQETGALIASRAMEKKIKKVAFDRSGFKYHGRIRALADAARQSGLEF